MFCTISFEFHSVLRVFVNFVGFADLHVLKFMARQPCEISEALIKAVMTNNKWRVTLPDTLSG